MEAVLVKRGGVLYPATEADKEAFRKVPQGESIKVKWSRMRNGRFHRKFFSLVKLGYEHSEHPNQDAFLDDLKIMAGHYDKIVRMDGSIWLRPRSISWARMDEDQFSKFYNTCLQVILDHCMAGADPEEVNAIVSSYL